MEKKILTTILLLFYSLVGTSQQETQILKYTNSYKSEELDTFRVNEEEVFEYDLSGNLNLKVTKHFNSDGIPTHWEGIFYEYSPSHLLKKESIKRYNTDVDLWIAEDFIEYEYDTNNCLIEKTFIENIGGKIRKKENYVVNEDCQCILKEISTPEWSNDTLITPSYYFERNYFPDGISFLEEYNYYFSNGDSSAVDRWFFLIFNEAGNIIERHNIYTHTQHTGYVEEKFTTEYDQFDNRILNSKFKRESDTAQWDLNYTFYYHNMYDDNDFLIETKEELISYSTGIPIVNPNSEKTIRYKNSCEGIYELVDTKYENSYVKEQYIYRGKNECIDLEKIHLNMSVTPNPSSGVFNIFSPIFQTGDTEIFVYSIDGKALLQKKEIDRSNAILDLSFLPNGIYILQLINGDHFVKEKIVITK